MTASTLKNETSSRRTGALLLSTCLLLLAGNARAQQTTAAPASQAQAEVSQPSTLHPGPSQPSPSGTVITSPAANGSEDPQILADSKRLFQLAAELKLDLVNSPPGTLSLEVVKKAAEVEQLARSLNQRMKTNQSDSPARVSSSL